VTLTGSFNDPNTDDTHEVVINWDDGSADTIINLTGGERSFSATHQYLDDDPSITSSDLYTISVTVTDDDDGSDTGSIGVTVYNVDPLLSDITLESDGLVIPVGSTVTTTAVFTDVGTADTHTAIWDWGDGTTPGTVSQGSGFGSVTDTHVYTVPGVYLITLTVTDDDSGSATTAYGEYIVVFDPGEGFVTGGGWIISPVGACQYTTDCETATGKANFGFVSRYKKGDRKPTGKTEFQFQAGDLNFHSDSYEWLIVSGARAQYMGVGTINGEGEYKFRLTAFDAEVNENDSFDTDRFRIKIWYEDELGEDLIVYDNGFAGEDDLDDSGDSGTTEIESGSIVIHTGKGGKNK
jgi:hypothetical protein